MHIWIVGITVSVFNVMQLWQDEKEEEKEELEELGEIKEEGKEGRNTETEFESFMDSPSWMICPTEVRFILDYDKYLLTIQLQQLSEHIH